MNKKGFKSKKYLKFFPDKTVSFATNQNETNNTQTIIYIPPRMSKTDNS